MLQRIFQKYSGWLRSLKAVYVVNNFLNARWLRQNQRLYEKYGLRKSVFAPIGHQDFQAKNEAETPWLDRPDALERMTQHPDFQLFTKEIQAALIHFLENGYLILPRFFSKKGPARVTARPGPRPFCSKTIVSPSKQTLGCSKNY